MPTATSTPTATPSPEETPEETATPTATPTTSASETPQSSLLTVGVECVSPNSDGTKTAYLSYNNLLGQGEVSVETDSNEGTVNEFIAQTGSPIVLNGGTVFKEGLVRGEVVVLFEGDSLIWQLKTAGSTQSEVVVSDTTPSCAALQLSAQCIGYSGGFLKARVGYENPNAFDLVVPQGTLNQFTSGPSNRGQPSRFLSGFVPSAFEAVLESEDEEVSWTVNGSSVLINPTLPVCEGLCFEVPTSQITEQLDTVAIEFTGLVERASQILQTVPLSDTRAKSRRKRDFRRVQNKLEGYRKASKEITIQIPSVIKSCTEAPQFCTTIDRGPTLDELRGLYTLQFSTVKRVVIRAFFLRTGKTPKRDRLVRRTDELRNMGLAELAKLPRIATVCK